ncbi:energy transducer TonB [Flavobacterium sp.]|uniref:energy transducer TonB n=1 Tax=Flavobacterium sp. TaxID=239 RepID=UPI00286C5CBE|nr:energy transducer TonB [Flavobacterium sp.]
MSKSSIYETNWINLVFENRNQEYGAYQLRQESSRTTMLSFFMGMLLIVSLSGIYKISSLLATQADINTIETIDEPLIIADYVVEPIIRTKTPLPQNQARPLQEPNVLLPMVVSATPDVIVDVPRNQDVTENQALNSGNGEANVTSTTGSSPEVTTLPIDYGTTVVATSALDKLPEFPGGINKFYNFVGNNFEKPEIENTTTMRILVSFVVEKDGSMTDIQVKRDPGYGLGKEAIRVLKSLKTKWVPGMIGSKPVRTSYSLPITVQMD